MGRNGEGIWSRTGTFILLSLVRQSRDSGGWLSLGCVKDLQPVWLLDGDDMVEDLSISISIKTMSIRSDAVSLIDARRMMQLKEKKHFGDI